MESQLKKYLDLLEREKELIRISKEVDPRFEASGIIKRIQQSVNKAILFEKVRGYDLPFVTNILGTYKRVAMILGCQVEEINSTWNKKERELDLFAPFRDGTEQDSYIESAIHEIPSLIY